MSNAEAPRGLGVTDASTNRAFYFSPKSPAGLCTTL